MTGRPSMAHLILRGSLTEQAEAELERRFTVHRVNNLEKLPVLKIVAISGVGTDALDLAAAKRRGIAVTITPDVHTVDVAEATLALLLSSTLLIAQADAFVRAGKWEAEQNFQLGIRLAGKRVGIIGVGKIGSELARLLGGFNVQIGYVSRFTELAGAQLFAKLD